MAVILKFIDGQFTESDAKEYDAKLELIPDGHAGVAKLSFSDFISLINRRIAIRQANSICASGFQLKNGTRIGRGYDLEILGEDEINDSLKKEGHKYNR